MDDFTQMQAAGSPPAELMGSAAAGEGGTEGLEIPPELEAGCPVQ